MKLVNMKSGDKGEESGVVRSVSSVSSMSSVSSVRSGESGEGCENYVHCAMLGDGMVGKTCLTLSYTQRLFTDHYTATVFDNYSGESFCWMDQWMFYMSVSVSVCRFVNERQLMPENSPHCVV